MNETCEVCGYWKGLHEFQTMRCPVDGRETGLFADTVYTNNGLAERIAAIEAENAKLRDGIADLQYLSIGAIEEDLTFDELAATIGVKARSLLGGK